MMSKEQQKNCKNNTAIVAKSISKTFDARRVLKGIDLTVTPGQTVLICGINGSGKSTLLRIIAGLLQPDYGTVKICGHNIHKDPEIAKPKLGVISHKSMVYADLTVFENLMFFANLYGLQAPDDRIKQLLKEVGLVSYSYDKAAILSRGLLQRLAIARAMIHKPTILLADEPFTGLDTDSCEHLVAVLSDFQQKGGTIVMTTHDINLGLRCCRRAIVLDSSKIIFDAPTDTIDADDFAKDYVNYAGSKP